MPIKKLKPKPSHEIKIQRFMDDMKEYGGRCAIVITADVRKKVSLNFVNTKKESVIKLLEHVTELLKKQEDVAEKLPREDA